MASMRGATGPRTARNQARTASRGTNPDKAAAHDVPSEAGPTQTVVHGRVSAGAAGARRPAKVEDACAVAESIYARA